MLQAESAPNGAQWHPAALRAEAQKQKMDQAATKHAGKIKGNTEPNAGGENRETGDRKARMNDRATNGGE